MIDVSTKKVFTQEQAVNQREGLAENYQSRYLVLNLDSVGPDGFCKGVQEHYPEKNTLPIEIFPELTTEIGLKTYRQSVEPYYSKPGRLYRLGMHEKRIVCVGQTISLCELRNKVPYEVVRLVTSSVDSGNSPPFAGYYSPYSFINTRNWAENRGPYTPDDALRDKETGGVSMQDHSGRQTFALFEGRWVMPNFMNVVAMPGYSSNPNNGLHELSDGETHENTLGAPVSQGCFRLTKYGAILLRWWTPMQAKTFIYYTPQGYKKWADLNGKAG